MKMKSSIVFPLLLVLALAFASVVFTKADLEFIDFESHHRKDPEQKYKECLQRCERRHEGQSFQEHCQDDCKERRRQSEERRAHEQGGSQGRQEEEQRQEEERRREQQREEEERREEERGGGKGREEQQRQEERAREEEEKARQEEQERGGRGRQEEEGRQEERKKAGGSSWDSKKQYKECLSECGRQSQGRSSQDDCKKQCKEKWQKGGRQDINENSREREEQKESEQEGETSPYVFEDQHFSTIIQTQQGRVRTLPRFTERSKLLKGIDNYRVLIVEAEPQTFILPSHYDADFVIFVAQGKGTVTLVRQNKRESYNIRRGDVAVIPAGTTAYVINRSKNEKLIVAKLVRPINTPGRFESYFGAGGEEPKSFYRTFSKEILEAAFNTKRENIERIFGQQRQGAMVKASEEQIRELSRHEEGGIWPFGGGESKGTVNIYQQRSPKSNRYGQIYRVDGSNLHQLQDLDVAVSVTNISEGSMSTLLYNSRATKIAIVVNGEGYLEMACPHLSQSQEGRQGRSRQQGQTEEERKSSPSYQKVTARLRRGVVVVIPAGHPHVAVASENQNLEIVSFAINANNNEWIPLAGRSNVINQLERAAKELAFGVPAKEVDEVFRNQEEEEFFKGPSQRQGRGQHESRADA